MSVLHGAVVLSLAALVVWLVGGRGWTRASAQTTGFLRVEITQMIEEVGAGDDAGPNSMALADINKDGALDLIAVGRDDGVVFVFRGVGDGTFIEPPETIDVDIDPFAVAVADVASTFDSPRSGDADGNLDIIVTDDGGGEGAQILLNTGEGTFVTGDEVSQNLSDFLDEGDAFAGIVVGDFDRNGRNDLALLDGRIGDEDASRVFFLCNNAGNFAPCPTQVVETNGEAGVDIGIGKFDGDDFLDIVVLNQGTANYSMLYGDGAGNFTADPSVFPALPADADEVQSLDVGRLNNDTLDDFVIASAQTGVLEGIRAIKPRGQNVFFPADDYDGEQADTIAVAIGDVNGDSATDAVFAFIPVAGTGGGIGPVVLTGNGTGGFFRTGFENPAGAARMGDGRAIVLGNFGGDALLDMIQLSGDGDTISVAINTTNQPTPTGGIETPATPTVTGSPPPTNTPTATVPTTTATATATPTPIPVNYGRCHVQVQGDLAGIATGQFDGDGSPDIAVTDPTNNAVHIIFNNAQVLGQLRACAMSPPVFIEEPITVPITSVTVGSGPGAIAAIDIDRDGDVDLLVAEEDGITILRNNGGVFTTEPALPADGRPAAIAVDYPIDPRDPSRRAPLDLNSDGRTDFVVANAGSPTLSIFYGRDDGLTIASRNIPGNASSVAVADFNQDGRVDIVAARGSDAVLLLQQRVDAGQSVFQLSSFGAGGAIVALATGFFNGDRSPDVLITRAQGLGQVYLSNGSTLAAAGGFQTGSEPTASGIGLFNATDGNADAVVSSRKSGSMLAFGLGNGAGEFNDPVITRGVRGRPAALSVADIDDDGMADVVTANGDGTISVLLSGALPPTPTPPATATLTPTPTPSETGTPGDTPTVTPSASPTASVTDTPADTPTRTPTPSPVNTQKEGVFELSGAGCSIDDMHGRFPGEVVALTLLLAAMRWSRRRAHGHKGAGDGARKAGGRRRWFLAGAGIATLLGSPTPPAHAQSLPTYVTCRVGAATLGATNSGLGGGAADDFDNNRSQDLALVDSNKIVIARTNIELFRHGSCPEAITAGSVPAQGPSAIAVALINNDVMPDLAVAQRSAGSVALFNGDGQGGFMPAGTAQVDNPRTVAVDSITNDGLADLVVGERFSVALLLGRTDGTYLVTSRLMLGDDEVRAVGVADFSGDTQLDIATVDALGTVRVFVQTAPGVFGAPVVFSIGFFPTDMQVAHPLSGDFNRDGIPDLAFVGNDQAGTGRLRVFLGRRTAGVLDFVGQPAVLAGASPSALGLADLNGDGRLDAAVTDVANAQVLLFLGNGAGGLSLSGDPRDTQVGANGIVLADVDGDNRADIITTNGDGSLTIFLSSNPPPTPLPTATSTSLPTSSPTSTPESSATPTPSDTPSMTPTVTATRTVTLTRTPSATRTFTETPITPGIFAVQGEGCAHVGTGGGASDAMPLVVLAALALLRRRGKP